jgi:hypothetical protein
LFDYASSTSSPIPITFNMTYAGSGSGTRGASSSQPSTSSIIGSIYIHQFHVQSTTNPTKVIRKYGLFQFEEDSTTIPWHVSSPLNIAHATHPLLKLKEHLPKFSRNNIVTTNEHLVEFSNTRHNIKANDNDTCKHLFFNSLKGKVVADLFELHPKILSTWEELAY